MDGGHSESNRGSFFQRARSWLKYRGSFFQRARSRLKCRGSFFQRARSWLKCRGSFFQRACSWLKCRGSFFQRVLSPRSGGEVERFGKGGGVRYITDTHPHPPFDGYATSQDDYVSN